MLPRRQIWFLGAMTALAVALIISGLWELRLAGAVHELVCGTILLALVLVAWRTWPRSRASTSPQIERI